MGFYEELSRYYDEIFPVDAGDMDFIRQALGGAERVLDIGCGTGNKTALLAAKGRVVLGIDSDSGMIARAAADNAGQGLAYEVLDMRLLGERFAPQAFDGVICLGNTLVHLDGPEAVADLLRTAARLMERNGVLVLQILNYDRILDRQIRELPSLEGEHAVFERRYEPQGHLLRFRTRLRIKKSGESFDNDVPLYPLRRGELETALRASGFDDMAWYGGFAGEPYDGSTLPLLVVCRKE